MRYLTIIVAFFAFATSAHAQSFEAGSWGGKVRSGPGMHYKKVASLRNGDPVRVLKRTNEYMNGYPWYRISFRGGRKGYQWGGIMCAYDHPIDGLHQTCDIDRRHNASGNGGNTNPNTSGAWGCEWEGKLNSVNSNQVIHIKMKNRSGEHRAVFWINFDGQPVHYFDLNPGESRTQESRAGYPWMFTDGPGNCIELHNPDRNTRKITLRRKSPGFGPE